MVAVTLLVACAPRHQAEVVERKVLTQRELDEKIGGQFIRIVQPGDTLYSIAFGSDLDVNKVAAWNEISDTSRLIAGQRIRLTEPVGFRDPRALPKKNTTVNTADNTVKKTRRPTANQQRNPSVSPPPARSSQTSKPVTVRPATQAPKTSNQNPIERPVLKWRWPLRGTLLSRFNPAKGQQGIDIQGQYGQAVKASAAGEVVYVGDSLKGYGNLVIIKHTANYLSAYAHNHTIVVREGQRITQGQAIATLGRNLRGQSVSQFQIRKDGDPVDPMLYLNK